MLTVPVLDMKDIEAQGKITSNLDGALINHVYDCVRTVVDIKRSKILTTPLPKIFKNSNWLSVHILIAETRSLNS